MGDMDPNKRILDNYLVRLLQERGQPRFPPKNTEILDYRYKMTLRDNPDAKEAIDISDYPGQFLRGVGVDDEAVEMRGRILTSLRSCDAAIVLVDAEHLIAAQNEGSPYFLSVTSAASDICDLLRDAAEVHPTASSKSSRTTIPIAFCITKFDLFLDALRANLIPHGEGPADSHGTLTLDRAYAAVQELFSEFFEPPSGKLKGKDYLTLITTISLGYRVHEADPRRTLAPFNIMLPFEFCASMRIAAFKELAWIGRQQKGRNWNRIRSVFELKVGMR